MKPSTKPQGTSYLVTSVPPRAHEHDQSCMRRPREEEEGKQRAYGDII